MPTNNQYSEEEITLYRFKTAYLKKFGFTLPEWIKFEKNIREKTREGISIEFFRSEEYQKYKNISEQMEEALKEAKKNEPPMSNRNLIFTLAIILFAGMIMTLFKL